MSTGSGRGSKGGRRSRRRSRCRDRSIECLRPIRGALLARRLVHRAVCKPRAERRIRCLRHRLRRWWLSERCAAAVVDERRVGGGCQAKQSQVQLSWLAPVTFAERNELAPQGVAALAPYARQLAREDSTATRHAWQHQPRVECIPRFGDASEIREATPKPQLETHFASAA